MLEAARGLAFKEPPIFERGSVGRTAVSLPPLDVPPVDPAEIFGALCRKAPAGLPEVSEPEAVRHFVRPCYPPRRRSQPSLGDLLASGQLVSTSDAPVLTTTNGDEVPKDRYELAVLAGDGIGPEVVAAALSVLERVAEADDLAFHYEHHRVGAALYLETGEGISPSTMDLLAAAPT